VGIKCNENEPWVKHPTTANMSSSINSSPAATPPSVPAQNAFIAGDLSAMLVFLYILGMCTVGSGYNLIWRVNLGIYSEVYAATTYIYCKPIHQRSWLWVGLPTLYGSQQCIKAVHQCFRGGSEKRLWHCTHMHASHFTHLHASARICTYLHASARTFTHLKLPYVPNKLQFSVIMILFLCSVDYVDIVCNYTNKLEKLK